MNQSNSGKIAAISMARNDDFFVNRWIAYYGRLLGPENLFLVLDGHDQSAPEKASGVNVLRLPRLEAGRAKGDRNRARLISQLARSLFHRYERVIAHDIDECLVMDPAAGISLVDHLLKDHSHSSLSGLGLDVGQHLEKEEPIDPSLPMLEQRSFAHLSSRYTKAVVALCPLTWGSGFHRVKNRNFHIDPQLFLFHFGMADHQRIMQKNADKALEESGWKAHLERRGSLFELITSADPKDGDQVFARARARQQHRRPVHAWNKPGTLKEKPVIIIPERFREVDY